ncbi:MAG TPA: glycoside hydrolase family 15 protein [Pseudonocardiaceae bacterium]|nr:glycoside hydrolase family 15 protein [Pseudonocardiaceae bacterium]
MRAARRSGLALLAVVAVVIACTGPADAGPDSGVAPGCCGIASSWSTGDKDALGTSATTTSKVWYTVADGITSEVFYPRADVPNMQDMQYVITDGSTFVDLERDATTHTVAMPDPKSLEYTVTNTAKSGKYRITNTYVTDPSRDTLVIQTRFQSLDGGTYQLYLLENPSLAGGGGNDNADWDATDGALVANDTENLFGSPLTVDSALKVSTGFTAHDDGYSGTASDCYQDLSAHKALANQYDSLTSPGNAVQCGQIPVAADTTFTVALGYGSSPANAVGAANGSLSSGFASLEAGYRSGWNAYVNARKPAPSSVTGNAKELATYYTAEMALHAAEDKTYPGASVAGLATPWGNDVNGDSLNDGYHRVWGRDLYEQATGLIADGDTAQAKQMAQFMWNDQWIGSATAGSGTTYQAGAFPRYSPVSGVAGATAQELGCCEQLDQDSFAIILAYLTGLTDSATYAKIKITANHIVGSGPQTTERWEEQYGYSPSSMSAEIAGLVVAASIATANGDTASASSWDATADSWRNSLDATTYTTSGYWGGHSYFERIDQSGNPNDSAQICFQEGCYYAHDVVDLGFLELVRLGIRAPGDAEVAGSLAATVTGTDGNSSMQVTMPDGDVYFHRYVHDSYGESNTDCSGWPANAGNNHGRLWPVLSGERGEYAVATGQSAAVYLKSMADATNQGNFVPEQVWDRSDLSCFAEGTPTGSAAPLMWAEGQYIRLAQDMAAGTVTETPAPVTSRYGT